MVIKSKQPTISSYFTKKKVIKVEEVVDDIPINESTVCEEIMIPKEVVNEIPAGPEVTNEIPINSEVTNEVFISTGPEVIDEITEGSTPSTESVESTELKPIKREHPPTPSENPKRPRTTTPEEATALRKDLYAWNPRSTVTAPQLTPDEIQIKSDIHKRFVKKLGTPGGVDYLRLNSYERGSEIIPFEDDDNDDEDSEEPVEEEKTRVSALKSKLSLKGKPSSSSTRKGLAKLKLTPLEMQFVAIKRDNPDVLLIIEVGYKYRFFGPDALIASQELSLFLVPGRMNFNDNNDPQDAMYSKFASSSIPVQRLHVHVRRLVEKGHKVGVVNQMETAALKAVGDNKNAPFERKLTKVYTKATYIDDFVSWGDPAMHGVMSGSGGGVASGYMMAIKEEGDKVGILAVQPSTGDVIYDEFADTIMNNELETRLLHIQPCEIVIVGELSANTAKFIKQFGSNSAGGGNMRIETAAGASLLEATSDITEFYCTQITSEDDIVGNRRLEIALALTDLVKLCLGAMLIHMKEYSLHHLFQLSENFASFTARSHMLLNANTLASLEIFHNQTDNCEKGSLFWVLDHTRTKFGQRLLRKWVGQPLLDREELECRISMVEELKNDFNDKIDKITKVMSKLPDLEKGLLRIHYGRCSLSELLAILSGLERVTSSFEYIKTPEKFGFKTAGLNEHFYNLSKDHALTTGLLNQFDHVAAKKNDLINFFKLDDEDYIDIAECKSAITSVENELDDHLAAIKIKLKRPSLKYSMVSGLEYLVEIRNTEASKIVPKDWVKISATKAVSRFRSPGIIKLLQQLEANRDRLRQCCDTRYKQFLVLISSQHYSSLRGIINSLSTLDCLFSLASVSSQADYVKPTLVDTPGVEIIAGRHPMVEQLRPGSYISNDVHLSSSSCETDHHLTRALIITGPNMGGKSSYVRQVALICIMSQIGCFVPAERAQLGIVDAIFTRMGAHDNMLSGESTFMVELNECSYIMDRATSRSLVVLDEIGRGTGTVDGVAIAHAVLEYFVEEIKSLTLFVTHYPSLTEGREDGVVKNYHMGFIENEPTAEGELPTITFLYKMVAGVAHRSYGLNVARLASMPKSVIDRAAIKSLELESKIKLCETKQWNTRVASLIKRMQGELGGEEITELYNLAIS